MPRWDADAEGRLLRAAMELFLDRGYDQVTVAEIAERAGLTKRSFFRHYADKREVLFGGAAAFERAVVAGVAAAPAGASPLDAALAGVTAAGAGLTAWGEPVRLRQRVVDSTPELRERELIKLAAVTAAVAGALAGRGVPAPTADVTARAAVVVFTVAFADWAAATDPPPFPDLIRTALTRLRTAVAQPPPDQSPPDQPAPDQPALAWPALD